MNKKTRTILLTVVTSVLLLTLAIGGTMAWLVDRTESLTNTFTPTTIGVTLTETTGETYQMVPGATITKDPKVTIKAGSVPCYVFVRVEESGGQYSREEFLTYEIADGWTTLDFYPDDGSNDSYIMYRAVNAEDAAKGVTYPILKNNQVQVLSSVTKADMDYLIQNSIRNPQLKFTAYAIQSEHLVDDSGNPLTLNEDTAMKIYSMAFAIDNGQ